MAKTILAVDDSSSLRQMVAFSLKAAGYQVVEAVDGQDGFDKAKLQAVDLVLTDQNMPRMDGLALIKLLLAVDVAAPDAEDLNAIFRTAHSVKGGASTFGLNDMSEVTHILESLLDRIRRGEMALTAVHVDAFLAAKDILKMQLDGHRNGAAVDQ